MRAAINPAATFNTSESTTATSTGAITSPASLGSIVSPNAKKNTAANASRNGRTSRSIRCATVVSARTRPTMNAPIASETPTFSATPGG